MLWEVLIFRIMTREAGVIGSEGWGASGGGATPEMNLVLAVFFGGFGFIEALKGAVVTFVEMPGLMSWEIGLV